jgi:Spy/CpxP family protein refolding chaperone
MNVRTLIAGAAAFVAIAAVGVGAASAQPRDDKPSKSRASNDARFVDDFDPRDGCCFFGAGGRGAGGGWGRGGGRGSRGPGMHGRGFGGPGRHGGGFGWGGHGFGGGGFGRGAGLLHGGARIARALDLSDAQVEKLRGIREDHHRTLIQARADMDLARMDLAGLVKKDAPSAGVERQIDVLARMHADQMKSMLATHRAALDVLTAKQRDQLKSMRGRDNDGDDDARPRRGSRR